MSTIFFSSQCVKDDARENFEILFIQFYQNLIQMFFADHVDIT